MIQVIENPSAVVTVQTQAPQSFRLDYAGEPLLIDPVQTSPEQFYNTVSLKRDGVFFARKTAGEASILCDRAWENLRIIAVDAANCYDGSVEKAIRVWICNLPHQMVTVDIVKTTEDTSLCTQFSVNNRDETLNIHEYSQQRLVFRRGGQGLKLFELISLTDGVPVSADLDHTQAGPVVGYAWEDKPGKEHLRVHTYSMDTSEAIPRWHVRLLENNAIRMEYPGAEDWWDVLAEPNRITLTRKNGKQEVVLL